MMLRRVIYFLYFFLGIILLGNCAKMGSITGGPKDIDPPKVVGSTPTNYSTNFNGNRIEITFDEFILLNNVNQALVISPPITGKPEIKLRGKTLEVNLEGEFRENTTYTLNFGNSIEDNNERNVLENFEFVFSTGDFLDSLSIEGTILNAFNHKPSEEPFIIMAYDVLEDSVPMKETPVYIGRSDKKGYFRINNMKADTFKIFAIKDLNFNYIFDLPNELIAFADSFVYLLPDSLEKWEPSITSDTTLNNKGNLAATGDSLKFADIVKGKQTWFKPYYVDLLFFEEDNRIQYLIDNDRIKDRHLFLAFNLPIEDSLNFKRLNFEQDDWFIKESNISRDTFNIWIKDSIVFKMDTISLSISYPGVDSSGSPLLKEDTLNMIHRKETSTKGRKIETPKPEFVLKTIANRTNLDLNSTILLEMGYPVLETDLTKIYLYNLPDSIEVPAEFTFSGDSLSNRKFYIESKWKSKGKYRMFIEPGAFMDIYGNINDTIDIGFNAQDEEYYGVLFVSTSNVKSPVIVQLMNERENVLEEKHIESEEKLTFSFLKPGRYLVKFVFDTNKNRKWDTGNYLKELQPEKIEYYVGEITIRSNWELEIKWELSDPD